MNETILIIFTKSALFVLSWSLISLCLVQGECYLLGITAKYFKYSLFSYISRVCSIFKANMSKLYFIDFLEVTLICINKKKKL